MLSDEKWRRETVDGLNKSVTPPGPYSARGFGHVRASNSFDSDQPLRPKPPLRT
ncbi:hypothetical protein OG21DRAFT_1511022 [Imleria badia]|nr:hypothetical protein OG21DRAFT_1511022 [Imleria badia]